MIGIMLMAYGSPQSEDDIEAYYTRILRNKKPSEEQVGRLTRRYKAIGMSSLQDVTKNQACLLEIKLKSVGYECKTYVGMKYSKPYIRDALLDAIRDGIEKLICIPIAPFYSQIGTESYFNILHECINEIKPRFSINEVRSWNMANGLIDAWIQRIEEIEIEKDCTFVFSAHSLPIKEDGGPEDYVKQLLLTSDLIAKHFGNKWCLAFQSAADMEGRWLGPDIKDTMAKLVKAGRKKLLMIPVGFVSDNLETAYDIGIECRNFGSDAGAEVKIAGMPNASEGIISALANAVIAST